MYDGFGAGNRNWHFHMRKPNERRHYWRFQITIDLRGYLQATPKYSITAEPTISLYREDVEHGDLCRRRDRRLAEQLAPVDVNPAGVWTFEVDDMSEGVVDASWDVSAVT